jgi:peptidoglycan hydrolase-like protein with peptidoglycan-binding domain
VLAYGHKGEAVKALQILLNGYGHKVGTTGNFGSGTREVLQKAQEAAGIPMTGKADEATWKALLGIRGEGEDP